MGKIKVGKYFVYNDGDKEGIVLTNLLHEYEEGEFEINRHGQYLQDASDIVTIDNNNIRNNPIDIELIVELINRLER